MDKSSKTTSFSRFCLWGAIVYIIAIIDFYLNGGLLKSFDDNLGFENSGCSKATVSLIALSSPAMLCYDPVLVIVRHDIRLEQVPHGMHHKY
jgi:hypothetical protein